MTRADFPDFSPHPLLRNGHLQTIASAYAPTDRIPYRATQRMVALQDGDSVVLHDDCPADWQPGDRVGLLLHGVTGCHGSPYMVRVAAKLNAAGIRTFRMDLRGFGAGYKFAKKPGHAGRSEDAAAALQAIAQWCPQSPATLIGFSMGGNIALKLLGEVGAKPPGELDNAVAISPPIELMYCCTNLERGLNTLYSRSFVKELVRQVQRRRRFSESISRIPLLPHPRRLIEFDDRFTAPLSGFEGAADYYHQSSASPLLPEVRLPTLILAAEDDPMVPAEIFHRAQLAPSIDLRLTRRGGHVAFIGVAGVDPDRWWIDWRIVQWVIDQNAIQAAVGD